MKPEPRGIGISFIRDMIPEKTVTEESSDSGSITDLEFLTTKSTPVVQMRIINTDFLKKKN